MTVSAIAAVTEVTAGASDINWEPHTEAARDLILIALDRASGKITVPETRLNSRVRELCKLDSTTIVRETISATLVLMERDAIVIRSTVDNGRAQLALPRELSAGEIGDLVANEDETRKRLIVICERIQLFRSCRKGYGAVVKAADGAELKNEKGYVGLNMTGVLTGVGLIRSHTKRVRYYLRMLGLVKSHGVCRKGEDEFHLYWWEVAVGKEVDVDALTALVDGNNSYEKEMARQHEKRRRQEEDGPRERRHAGDTPAVLTDDMCSPVVITVRQEPVVKEAVVAPVVTQNIETRAARRPSPLDVPGRQPAVEPVTEPDGDLLSEVVAIATRLEGERDRLIAEHAAELERREAKHATEVAGLNKVIDDLRQQLAAHGSTSAAARELLARHRQA